MEALVTRVARDVARRRDANGDVWGAALAWAIETLRTRVQLKVRARAPVDIVDEPRAFSFSS